MQVLFVGGADSVGASCLAVEMAKRWFIVDAGVRVDHRVDPLPDLSLLEGKDVAAIFVTHAHADHIGALPLVHQAFPMAPIYASRATGLLMEVMLADALRIMEKRAVDEMELPLYQPELVKHMLNLLRPLPLDTPFTIPQLPDVTIQASRAGHIAGAISLGFEAPDGSLVVSGDISLTDQRTVAGAVPPPIKQPDLLILESTYGARLHANRQAEEARFAQAVATGIGCGGHVLLPTFGLGRGQEVLLVLQDAIQKQQIPPFLIYVDGLVRRVCNTYLLLPEALTPRLQRQIRKGYLPFSSKYINFVRNAREREQLLAGPPACIVSSSGMLTGGPSAWYAARLAEQPAASILLTGYQDEESPGKKLLDVAAKRSHTLELEGQQVPVHCQVGLYSLSAHADGGELAAYAAALKPKHVALVHGEEEARASLRIRLAGSEVFLPRTGTLFEYTRDKTGKASKAQGVTTLAQLPSAIGEGQPFVSEHIERLWQVVSQEPTLRIVTARELAQIWYGEASEEEVADLLDVLASDRRQRYFVPQEALEEAFRVRTVGSPADLADAVGNLVGQIIVLQVLPESVKPAFFRGRAPGATIWAALPKGASKRNRFAYDKILEVLGSLPEHVQEANIEGYLDELVRASRSQRREISARELASLCNEDALYSLDDLCGMVDVDPQDLAARLAVAKVVLQNPQLFTLHGSVLENEDRALYKLAHSWQEALSEPEAATALPDQQRLLKILEKHLGNPSDLYKRSIDPQTGRMTLFFHYPGIAREHYAEALKNAAEEAKVEIRLNEQPHQGAMVQVAQQALPTSLQVLRSPSVFFDRKELRMECAGQASMEEIAQAEMRFQEDTGWTLSLVLPEMPDQQLAPVAPTVTVDNKTRVMDMHTAIQYAQHYFAALPGYLRMKVEANTQTLMPRFTFPDVARERHAELTKQVEAATGWRVRFSMTPHQEALAQMAEAVLPEGLLKLDAASLHQDARQVVLVCAGNASAEEIQAAQEQFLAETGWRLMLLGPEKLSLTEEPNAGTRLNQAQALAHAGELFREAQDLYQVGADEKRKVLWLHFYFPDIARERYAEQIKQLASESGWDVELHKNVHQKKLVELAQRLLPDGVQPMGKKSLHQEIQLLRLTCLGQLTPEQVARISQQFRKASGWDLELSLLSPL
jgi:Cft2 family RNA processing exonuclease